MVKTASANSFRVRKTFQQRLDENLAEGMTPVQAALKARADQLNERFNDDYEAF